MAETATSTRLPDDWRYVEEEHRYAKAIRENYHPNGNHRAIVLVELKDSGRRVGLIRFVRTATVRHIPHGRIRGMDSITILRAAIPSNSMFTS